MLTLKNLSLTASDAQGRTDIVKNVSLDVEDGKFLVITGPNGGGKTTLCNLIPRFYDATSGHVCIDGRDVKTVTLESLRRAIGINDKFLLIRDLFGGDGEAYEKAIGALNDCADFDDCMIYIAENYAWNPNSDGVKLLMDLLERKFA